MISSQIEVISELRVVSRVLFHLLRWYTSLGHHRLSRLHLLILHWLHWFLSLDWTSHVLLLRKHCNQPSHILLLRGHRYGGIKFTVSSSIINHCWDHGVLLSISISIHRDHLPLRLSWLIVYSRHISQHHSLSLSSGCIHNHRCRRLHIRILSLHRHAHILCRHSHLLSLNRHSRILLHLHLASWSRISMIRFTPSNMVLISSVEIRVSGSFFSCFFGIFLFCFSTLNCSNSYNATDQSKKADEYAK
jgi:hypothetical protein